MVTRIIEYRNAKEAIRLANAGREGITQMQANPGLGTLLVEINRAQGVEDASMDGLMADMQSRTTATEEENDDR